MVLLVAGGAALGFGSGSPGNRYQSVGYTGEHPFTSPVGTDESVVPVVGGGTRWGDSAGLYQQDPDRPACDGAALAGALAADPARAGAWARVQGVSPSGVAAFVAGLHPVVLRADTAVVDHGYRDGGPVGVPAVLAAGTAVLVDGHGRPAVKCLSGDPLTPGASTDASVTTIVASPEPVTTLTVFDPVVERLVDRPMPHGGPGPAPTTGNGHVRR
jgi:hypothetical protein